MSLIRPLLDSTRDCFVLVGHDLAVQAVNKAFCDFFKSDQTLLVGRSLTELFEIRFLENGTSALVIKDQNTLGELQCAKTFENFTYRNGSLLLQFLPMNASETIAHEGLENMPLPSLLVDSQGRILLFNKAFEKHFFPTKVPSDKERSLSLLFSNDEAAKIVGLMKQLWAANGNEELAEPRTIKTEAKTLGGKWSLIHLSCNTARPLSSLNSCLIAFTDITHLKKLEGNLFASEERFALVVSGSLDGIWDWKIQTRELYFSRRLCELLGYEKGEFRRFQRNVRLLIHPNDRHMFFARLVRHLRHKGVFDVELRGLHKTSEVRWYRVRGQATWDSLTGKAQRMAGSLTDVTENRLLRLELQSKLDSIDSESLLVELDRLGNVTDANKVFCRISGYPLEQLQHRFLGDFLVADETQPFVLPDHQNTHQNSKVASRDFTFLTPTSERLYVRGALSPMYDIDGALSGFHFFGFDVTEKRRAEKALHAEIAFRRAVLDSAASIVITTDNQGVITMINGYALRKFGYEESEIVLQKTPGLFLVSLKSTDLLGGARSAVQIVPERQWRYSNKDAPAKRSSSVFFQIVAALRPGRTITQEASFRTRKGQIFPVLMSVSLVESNTEEPLGYVIVAQDITELKRIEQLKSDFVSTVSHELRTPLTSISGALKLVDSGVAGALPAKAKSLLSVASRNSERLIHLINDLLDMQKIESGKMSFNMMRIDLARVVTLAIESMQTYFSEKGIKYEVQLAGEPVYVVGDSDRLVQVVVNLLSNAVKFSESGGLVCVSLSKSLSKARVGVRDFGNGIPVSFQKEIFEKFSQADSSDAKQKGGTGLGLAISKAIIDTHSGKISFWSAQNKGTEFFFEIPLHEVESQNFVKDDYCSRGNVLTVEDDPDIAHVLVNMIEGMGYRSFQAHSIAEALEILETQKIDMVTLDLVMPDLHGGYLIERLSHSEPATQIPVLVISGIETTESAKILRWSDKEGGEVSTAIDHSSEVFSWLSKPVRSKVLEDELRRAAQHVASKRVVFVLDDASFFHEIKQKIGAAFEIVLAQSLTEAEAFLKRHPAGLCIFLETKWEQTVQLCERLRSIKRETLFAYSFAKTLAPADASIHDLFEKVLAGDTLDFDWSAMRNFVHAVLSPKKLNVS